MADTEPLSIDPFADDIVNDPRRVDYSVPGLNESVAGVIASGVDALCAPKKPSLAVRSSKALVVISPRAGYGKSHLIGTVFKRLSGKATLVNIRPFQDAETKWKSVLDRVVQELTFADRFAEPASDSVTQLEFFAHGCLSQIVADFLEAQNGNKAVIELLRKPAHELTGLKRNKKWREQIDKVIRSGQWLARIERPLAAAGLSLHTPLPTWLRVLYSYAYQDDDWDRRQSCLDWMQASSIEDETADAIGIRRADRVRTEQTAGELNELAKARVLDLCRLAGFFRPFLFCFDQTETYGRSPELARGLGDVITDLVDEAHNHLTVITANLDPWEKQLQLHWQRASRDRLANPHQVLEGISLQQGLELAEHRLGVFDVDRPTRDSFWGDRKWIEEIFAGSEQMSVREFLHECSGRWAERTTASAPEATPAERIALPTLFERYTDEVSAKPRRLVFDRDTFYWLVKELAVGLDGLDVDTLGPSDKGRFPRWRYAGKEYVFGFESGSHWKRWHNIARSALGNGAGPERILVYPRTPELPRIPKPTWKVAKPDIDAVRRTRLLVLELKRPELVALYAAQELYADALQGDIDWSTEDVAAFLRERLANFWRSILEWPDETARKAVPEQPEPSALPKRAKAKTSTAPRNPESESDALSERIIEAIRKQKFLS
jgi:hypothetical protein